jgi:hypothetical protein
MIERRATAEVTALLDQAPVVALLDPLQVGKTTPWPTWHRSAP